MVSEHLGPLEFNLNKYKTQVCLVKYLFTVGREALYSHSNSNAGQQSSFVLAVKRIPSG